jgi:gliding motility-associated-like protein/uncharacterized delta-60 repeat protein
MLVTKLDGTGNFLWANSAGSSNNDAGNALATDAVGNIYLSGSFYLTVDFNAGVGINNLTSNGGQDIFILKLDALGNFNWVVSMGGANSETSTAILVDNTEIRTTGYFQGTVDFDPSPGIFSLTSPGTYSSFVQRISTAPPPPPTITSFAPGSGSVGSVITISGSNFDFTKSNNIVRFNGTLATVLSSSQTSITTLVPTGATTGPVTVRVGTNTATSATNFTVTAPTSCVPAAQRAALIALYFATDGSNWFNKANWLSADESTWAGVTVIGCAVTRVVLQANGLVGNIPSEIGNLPSLIELDLSENSLIGSLPSSITTLTNLQLLFLNSNSLEGSLPINIGNLTSLKEINTQHNLFSGSIPPSLVSCTSLQNLKLDNNKLTGDIPSFLGSIPTLTGVNLGSNLFTGTIPPQLENLASLNFLSLSNNSLSGNIPSTLGNLTNIQVLDLSRNQLTGSLPIEIGNLSNLLSLQLWANQLSGNVPTELANLNSLQEIYLDQNKLEGAIPPIGVPGVLQILSGTNNNFDDVDAAFSSFSELTTILLANNKLTSIPLFSSSTITQLAVEENYLDMEDLLPNASVTGYSYDPQAKLPTGGLIAFTVGTTVTIPFTTPGTGNTYQWYQDGSLLTAANSNTLIIPNATLINEGSYYVRVRNPLLPFFSLQSKDYVLISNPCPPSPRINGTIDITFDPKIDNPTTIYHSKLQSTGQIIASMNSTTVNGTPVSGLVRFNSDGSLDNTFTSSDYSIGVIIQPDDKILVYSTGTYGQVIRLNADGTDDVAFNTNTNISANTYAGSMATYGMNIQPDGKIVYSYTDYGGLRHLDRLNADGTLDNTFSPPGNFYAKVIRVQSDGKILAVADDDFVYRFNADGSNDPTFNIAKADGYITDFAIQPDGKIILVGTFNAYNNETHFGVVRLDSDGSIDSSFSSGIADLAPDLIDVFKVSVLNNNKILVAGIFVTVKGATRKNMVILNSDGSVDCSFDPGASSNVAIQDFAVQTDGKILIAGDFTSYDGTLRNGLARVNNDVPISCVSASERAALIAFYNTTNGTSWTNKTNWLSADESTWYGVTVTGCQVTDVSLYNNNLTGTLPATIGDLTNLINLDIRSNQVAGVIPTSLGTINTLQNIILDQNLLTGIIPNSIFSLTNLKILELGGNQLTGSIPTSVSNLVNLEALGLSTNQLSGSLPTELGSLTMLTRLQLAANQFSGNLPASIGNLVNLTEFSVFNNQLSGAVPTSLSNLVNLTGLGLSVNQFTGAVPPGVGLIPNLTDVSLRDNDFNYIPEFVSTSFTDLLVYGNKLDFGHLEPNIGKGGFVYAPQDNLPGGVASACVGSTLTINFSTPGTANQYQWLKDGSPITGATSATFTKSNAVAGDAGSYSVRVTNTIVTGLTLNSDPFVVTITALPSPPNASGVSVCPGNTATLTANGGTNGQYRWYTVASGGSAITGQTSSSFVTPAISTITTFYVSLFNGTCESTRTAVTVTSISTACTPPVITSSPLATQVGGLVTLDLVPLIATFNSNLDINSLQVIVPPSSGAQASIVNGVLTINYTGITFSGSETLTIRACDLAGNCSQQQFTIEVIGEVNVYNAVSPNSDGKNEFLVLQYIETISPKNQVSIYNRWGDEVFSISDYDNKTRVFAGLTSGGNKLPSGTYFYKIALTDANKTLTGFISLKY